MNNDFYNLADQMQEQFRKDETTTMNAISYLPSQVGVVRSALGKLKKVKKKWNLEIMEQEGYRIVKIEDALRINVPNEHWEDFQSIFNNTIDEDSYLNLNSLLFEEGESEDLLQENLRTTIFNLFGENAAKVVDNSIEKWIDRFGVKEWLVMDKGMLPLVLCNSKEEGIEGLLQSILKEYEDDRGNLEILIEDIDSENSLESHSVFENCKFLYGGRIQSEYEGINLIFEARMSIDRRPSFSIWIEDDEIADLFEEYLQLATRRVGNVFYPVSAQFPYTVLDCLKEVIEDAQEPEE